MPEEMNGDYFSRWIAREKEFIKAALETDAFPKRKKYMEDLGRKLSGINTDTAFVVIVKTPLYVVWERKYSKEDGILHCGNKASDAWIQGSICIHGDRVFLAHGAYS